MPPLPVARSATEFYAGGATDQSGRTIRDLLAFGDDELEYTHDFIQWLFPLREPSGVNPYAPTFKDADARAFAVEPALRETMLAALRMMLRFYGLQLHEEQGEPAVRKAPSFPRQASNWLARYNHNFLRITRIMKSLRLAGLPRHADAVLEFLRGLYAEAPDVIGERTWSYWQATSAADGPRPEA